MSRRVRAAFVIALVGGGWAFAGLTPSAEAGCVRADVWVSQGPSTTTTYLTPWTPGHCLVPTLFNEATTVDAGKREGWVPPPAYNGAGARVTVVVP